MVVRITVNVLRVAALLALILGVVFWTGNAKSLVAIHMLLGIIVTLSLVLGFSMATTKGGNIGLAIGAIVFGLLLLGLGLTQRQLLPDPSVHWTIQVLHLLFGLIAIGFGEMISGRYKRLNAPATQPASS